MRDKIPKEKENINGEYQFRLENVRGSSVHMRIAT